MNLFCNFSVTRARLAEIGHVSSDLHVTDPQCTCTCNITDRDITVHVTMAPWRVPISRKLRDAMALQVQHCGNAPAACTVQIAGCNAPWRGGPGVEGVPHNLLKRHTPSRQSLPELVAELHTYQRCAAL